MRTITTFSLFVFLAVHLAGQGFAPVGTKWTYSESDNLPPPAHWQPFYLYANEEEMYNGKLCRKITSSGFSTLPDPCYIYDRNDTVYFYSHITEQFEFLYDFKAQSGDVWEVRGLPGSSNNGMNYTCKIVIDSVVTRTFNGTLLKVWYFTNDPQFFDWGNTIIEGFGACFLMPSFGLFEQQICGARCLESPGVFQKYVDYDCDAIVYVSATSEPEPDRIRVYPSPASETLLISMKKPETNTAVEIYSITGRLMYSSVWENTISGQLDISTYPSGIYILKTASGSTRFAVQRY